MKTLEEIKSEYAREEGFLSWADYYSRTSPYRVEQGWHEVAVLYGEVCKQERMDKNELKIHEFIESICDAAEYRQCDQLRFSKDSSFKYAVRKAIDEML